MTVAEVKMSIELKNVSYSYCGKYQTVHAVDNVSYSFEGGKMYAIVGKSGSGKTTLLSLMAGLDLPSEGDVIVDGTSTRKRDRNKMRREEVSVIYQNYNLFPLLTVKENIKYPLSLRGIKKKAADDVARVARERVELSEQYDPRLPAHLSGGEQQRVAIARTLAQGSKIILADEPTGNLDTKNTENIVGILKELAHKDGATVIIVTHDMAVAEAADVILKMRDGSIDWNE